MTARFAFERFLNVRSAYAPSFRHDGARLAFISDITGVPQVWQIPEPGAWPEQLTFGAERVGTVAYSPTAPELVFGRDEGGNERQQLLLLRDNGAEIRPLTDEPDAIHTWGAFDPDGRRIAFAANRRHPAHFDVFIQTLPDGAPEPVFEGEGTYAVLDWAPDGASLLVSRVHHNFHQELFRLDLASGALERLTPERPMTRFQSARWDPLDPNTVYCLTDQDRDVLAPATIEGATGEVAALEEPEWDTELLAPSPDGRWLAGATNVDGYSAFWIEDRTTGTRHEVSGLPQGLIGAGASPLAFSRDGSQLSFSATGARDNPNVWRLQLEGADIDGAQQATFSARAGLPREELAEPELVRYPTFDEREIPAFLFRPPSGPTDRRPTVVYVHGGPESQFRPSFNPVIQYLAHRGYGVLAPNVRGSTGYGAQFSHLDDVAKRMDAVADLRAAAEWLGTSGEADPDRIAVMGGSYGGFMVLAALTTDPELWAAGVDIVGIANFVTFLENTGPWRRHLREAEYGSLEDDREMLERISPIHYVDRIRAPLMVLHGANDPRVPVDEAEQIVEKLQARDHPVEYQRFEDEGHGFVKLANKLTAYPAIVEFLDRHIGA